VEWTYLLKWMTPSPTPIYEPPALTVLGFVHELTLDPPGKRQAGPDAILMKGGGLTGAST
jgi:hypothetical protein